MTDTQKADPVTLALFANRFMGIAEAMGNALRHTSVSTNIKERLDFSCALFAADGSLISNAPHLPVHLGSMSFAVKYQVDKLGFGADAPSGDGIVEGDVLLSNSPTAGGSHLPDITVITPVFDKGKIIFFTASRGHHADVGGISPGSMSPLATTIFQEGAKIESFKIVRKGFYDAEGLRKRLIDEPASYPGSSGSRSYADVESDLRAQIAANQKGITLINALIAEWGLETVQQYMKFITDNAELAVRTLLKKTVEKLGRNKLHAIDYMDDGTPIELNITIDGSNGSAIFDFEGTGYESWSSLNAPLAVAYSAIIYCLRALCGEPIPLNSGCLQPIDIRIPEGTLINPSHVSAVVGGNVTSSQRVTDVVLRAFESCAASQGCCNNFTFGTQDFGFYETIAGGSGAGPGWHGTSGTQIAMTNTRITDVEIMERRYPVILREFSLREGSGGDGEYRGGNGVVRDVEFTIPDVQVSILSERRVMAPYGMAGGSDASRGKNTWIKQRRAEDHDLKEGAGPRHINLGPRNTVKFGKGDRFVLHSPGGGGYGKKKEDGEVRSAHEEAKVSSTSTFRGFMGSIAERAAAQLGV